MGCIRSLQDRWNGNMPNNVKVVGDMAIALEGNIKEAMGNAKLAGYDKKEEVAKNFDGTSVKTLSGDAFAEMKNQVNKNYGERDSMPEVNPLRERMNNLGYRSNSADQQER